MSRERSWLVGWGLTSLSAQFTSYHAFMVELGIHCKFVLLKFNRH